MWFGCFSMFGKRFIRGAFPDAWQTAEYHAICRRFLSSRCLLRRGAAEPLLETRRAEARVITGDKALIVQLCAEIQGVDIGDHLAWVSRCAQETPGEFIHSDRFGTGHLDRTV